MRTGRARVKPVISKELFVRPGDKDWKRRAIAWRRVTSLTTRPTARQLRDLLPFEICEPTALKWLRALFETDDMGRKV